ncbi:hypothetical protein V2E39_22365 [Chryseobacterium arthrosphaerae]|uniref:Uncharacterized protein n=1 Tax=Chryseobacterium arthrosphaerae TaxID=651561 RepID=A0A1B8ZPF1_9FLAO|nr:hypothetical protein [Chryseobacterium arthrosphaerae]MDG4654824.1 hypothetical protein [Chryseobacterium arthrosphaerae]OCA73478.1 hypothetical protein BBI00_03590 [Chryseobacterium arthrosphaerae]UEQ76934.1 hypothetical protein J8N07_01135 [Chryseobacterium arthrosphaerae]
MKKIFSEMKGFVIYSPELLSKYLQEYNLPGNNILKYFVENEHGDEITKSGIAIPVIGVEDDYYSFQVSTGEEYILDHSEVEAQSTGWIFQTSNNEVRVVGIGYLKDITLISDDNSIILPLENGWYSLKIRAGRKNGERLFELNMQRQDFRPDFKGDVTSEYYYG